MISNWIVFSLFVDGRHFHDIDIVNFYVCLTCIMSTSSGCCNGVQKKKKHCRTIINKM